jgi:Rieske Fe-S protein
MDDGALRASLCRFGGRRAFLKTALGVGLGLPLARRAAAQDADPKNARPRENDRFVFAAGERARRVVTPVDLPLGAPPVIAYPMDPKTSVVRDGSRLNLVLIVHLDPETLAAPTRANAAAGLVAYSAVCTHTGCEVSEWEAGSRTLKCPCHYSEFDPKESARVLGGPAPRRLAALPLKIADGALLAAGGFAGRVGFPQGGG